MPAWLLSGKPTNDQTTLPQQPAAAMSDTLHLACVDCRKELWVGQARYKAPAKAFLYSDADFAAKFAAFWDEHLGHSIRLVNMDGLEALDIGMETEAR